jgi:hypothetical protein
MEKEIILKKIKSEYKESMESIDTLYKDGKEIFLIHTFNSLKSSFDSFFNIFFKYFSLFLSYFIVWFIFIFFFIFMKTFKLCLHIYYLIKLKSNEK